MNVMYNYNKNTKLPQSARWENESIMLTDVLKLLIISWFKKKGGEKKAQIYKSLKKQKQKLDVARKATFTCKKN